MTSFIVKTEFLQGVGHLINVSKFSAIALSATVALSLSVSVPAFADGMPFKEKKPEPILTPLDEALKEIENKEPPVDVTAPAEPPPAPVAEKVQEKLPEPMLAPVPESRIVEVQPNTSFFGLSVGMYDPFSHGEQAASFNLEWQPGVKIAGVLQPLFGAMVTTEGSMLGYGGVGVPFKLGKRIFVMPSVAVGAYEEGNGYDLDSTLAFRFGTELAYEFDNKSRIGINAHILTNGDSLDRPDRTEIISLVYTTPLDALSGSNKEKMEEKKESNEPVSYAPRDPKPALDASPYKEQVNN